MRCGLLRECLKTGYNYSFTYISSLYIIVHIVHNILWLHRPTISQQLPHTLCGHHISPKNPVQQELGPPAARRGARVKRMVSARSYQYDCSLHTMRTIACCRGDQQQQPNNPEGTRRIAAARKSENVECNVENMCVFFCACPTKPAPPFTWSHLFGAFTITKHPDTTPNAVCVECRRVDVDVLRLCTGFYYYVALYTPEFIMYSSALVKSTISPAVLS